jgi:hypothetical protein
MKGMLFQATDKIVAGITQLYAHKCLRTFPFELIGGFVYPGYPRKTYAENLEIDLIDVD